MLHLDGGDLAAPLDELGGTEQPAAEFKDGRDSVRLEQFRPYR
jgi:hypothetical protein